MRTLFVTVVALAVLVAACSSAGEDVSPPTATGAGASATTEGPSKPRFGVDNESPARGNDRASATPLAAPGSVSGAASSGDPDWFVFDAVTGGTYAIDVAPESDGEFTVAVFDEEGEVPGLPVVQVGLLAGAVVWAAPTPGQYWLRVTGKWAVPFAYTLWVDFFETPPDDHGDSAADATAVVLDPDATPTWVQRFEHTANSRLDWLGEVQAAVTLSLGEPLDEDWFTLELEEGRRYRIAPLEGDPARQPVEQLTASPTLVVTVHRDGNETALRHYPWDFPIDFVPPVTGTYQLAVAGRGVVSSLSSLLPAPHAILVALFDPDAAPYLRENAVAVRPGAAAQGTFDGRGDLDWFALDAVAGQTWIARFDEHLYGCLEVYGPTGGGPLLDECGEGNYLWTAPTDGTYGIRLFPASDRFHTSRALYRFTMTPAAPDDHANHARGATVVTPGENPTGTIDYAGDTDMFRLPIRQGEVWTISIDQSAHVGTDIDAWFTEVDGREDGALPQPQCYWAWTTCALSAPRDGAWIIAIEGIEPGTDFELLPERLSVSDDYGDGRAHAPDLATPALPDAACQSEPSMDDCADTTTVEGRIDYRFDGDYFQISLTAGNKYEISIRSASDQAIFTVLEELSCAVPADEVRGQTRDVWIPKTTGDYWIRVGAHRDHLVGTGNYPPERYTLEIAARPDDYPTPEDTIGDTATELEPNTVHHATSDGRDLYRIDLNHPHYVIEVNGAGLRTWGDRRDYGISLFEEGPRWLAQLGYNPPIVYVFEVFGPEAKPYTVVVRESQSSDDELDWFGPPESAPPPAPNYRCPWDQ